jgi:plastocyanin
MFMPSSLTVARGATVTVKNAEASNIPHTWTADSGQADSWDVSVAKSGDSGSHTFNTAGKFTYHCNIHNFMMGSVTVT